MLLYPFDVPLTFAIAVKLAIFTLHSVSIHLQGIAAYSVSKKALIGVSDLFAKECAPKNIRVNAVAPGFIDTSFSSVVSREFSSAVSAVKIDVERHSSHYVIF